MRTPTVEIALEDGKTKHVELVVAYTGSPLGITVCEHTADLLTITHIPTGISLSGTIVLREFQSELTQLLDQLAQMNWPETQEEAKRDKPLIEEARRIIKDWRETLFGGAA